MSPPVPNRFGWGVTYIPPAPFTPPPDAGVAKKCSCDEPWVERDEDDFAHCVKCGRSI